MFGFGRKKKVLNNGTAQTFVDATNGGWGDSPDVISGDGGSQAGFVKQTLEAAYAYALEHEIPVGQEFEFTITDIPVGMSNPNEIVFGLMMQAQAYGLRPVAVANEKAFFARLE